MAYVPPKTFVNAYLALLRAWTTAPLSTCVFRKGPIQAYTPGSEPGLCIVEVAGLPTGEEPHASGNAWKHDWQLTVWLLVPDTEESPETAEDARLDLVNEFLSFMHANRTMGTGGTSGGVKVGRVTGCEFSVNTLFANTQQVYRAAKMTVMYQTIKN